MRLRRLNLELNPRLLVCAHRLELVCSCLAQTDGRGGLGHTVSRNERSLHLQGEKLFEMGRDGCTTGNEKLYIATKGLHQNDAQGITEIRIVLVIGKPGLAALAVNELSDGGLNHLGEDERNGEEH